MTASIYDDKLIEPNDKMLSFDLKNTITYFNRICEFIEIEYGNLKPEWRYYNKKSGWILKLFNRKRNVLFVVPCNKYFRIAFTFGDKASDKIYNSDLPEMIKKDLFETKKYAEGRTIQIEVKKENDLNNILKLIRVKLAN
jgi:hypothetical protein